MVFTGDEEPRGQAWESCALADSVRPQTIVAAQWDVRVDLENGSWPGSHVFASKEHVSKKDDSRRSKDIPRKSLNRRRSPTKHRPMLSSR